MLRGLYVDPLMYGVVMSTYSVYQYLYLVFNVAAEWPCGAEDVVDHGPREQTWHSGYEASVELGGARPNTASSNLTGNALAYSPRQGLLLVERLVKR